MEVQILTPSEYENWINKELDYPIDIVNITMVYNELVITYKRK